jgi:Tol biopolymer transport system component
MAQAFDAERGQLKANAQPVAERVASDASGNGFFDVSENGVLIYQGDTRQERRITWFDRAGKELGVGEGGSAWNMRLSPDGAKLGFNDTNREIWVDELARGVRIRLTNDPGTKYGPPLWSADSRRILFGPFAGKARLGIYQMNSNGVGGKELVLPAEASDPQIWPTSWSRDGRFILFVRGNVVNPKQDLWVLPLAGDRKPRLYVQNAFDGRFSPDGRWVAYTSHDAGRAEVYVVPFNTTRVLNTASPGSETGPRDKCQISTNAGWDPRWRGDGKEIFYWTAGGQSWQMMTVEVDGRGNSFAARKEQALFRAGAEVKGQYDVTPDGKRFVMTTQKVINPNPPLTLVVNWTGRLAKP